MSDDKKEIDITKIDLERMKKLVAKNPGTSHYPTQSSAPSFSPTKQGAIKSRAHKVMEEQISMQMDNIMEQIEVLSRQAQELKDRAAISHMVYDAKMNFEPLTGHTYYLYQGPDQKVLSMLGPEDFGVDRLAEKSMTYLASLTLMADCTWKVLDMSEDYKNEHC